MESLRRNQQEPHLKVIKSNAKTKKSLVSKKKLAINTLTPNFSYTNNKGEVTTPSNHILL